MNTEFHTPFEWFMTLCRCIYKTWMEGTYDIPNKNPYSLLPNHIGWYFCRNSDNYIFIFLKHIQINS